jgi:hypothetical protein
VAQRLVRLQHQHRRRHILAPHAEPREQRRHLGLLARHEHDQRAARLRLRHRVQRALAEVFAAVHEGQHLQRHSALLQPALARPGVLQRLPPGVHVVARVDLLRALARRWRAAIQRLHRLAARRRDAVHLPDVRRRVGVDGVAHLHVRSGERRGHRGGEGAEQQPVWHHAA